MFLKDYFFTNISGSKFGAMLDMLTDRLDHTSTEGLHFLEISETVAKANCK